MPAVSEEFTKLSFAKNWRYIFIGRKSSGRNLFKIKLYADIKVFWNVSYETIIYKIFSRWFVTSESS